MSSELTNQILNRLHVLHGRSLPSYLGYAASYWTNSNGEAQATLAQIIEDKQSVADRIGELIIRNDGDVANGSFPMRYTAYHDLGFPFLLARMLESQRSDLAQMEQCSSMLADPEAKALAEEAIGMARGHLESLEELAA